MQYIKNRNSTINSQDPPQPQIGNLATHGKIKTTHKRNIHDYIHQQNENRETNN